MSDAGIQTRLDDLNGLLNLFCHCSVTLFLHIMNFNANIRWGLKIAENADWRSLGDVGRE